MQNKIRDDKIRDDKIRYHMLSKENIMIKYGHRIVI
jgi:hypothetical protein